MPSIAWEFIPTYFHNYVKQLETFDLHTALAEHAVALPALLGHLSPEQWNHRYAPDKWNIKEVVQHIIDTERIFAYRALAIARGERQALPGFDENAYAGKSLAAGRSGESLLEEFNAVQQATTLLFKSFTPQHLAATGIVWNNPMYVAGIGFIIAGHCRHHLNILKERYLQPATAQL